MNGMKSFAALLLFGFTPSAIAAGVTASEPADLDRMIAEAQAGRVKVDSLAARATVLEAQPAPTATPTGGIVTGDLQVSGRICIGGPCAAPNQGLIEIKAQDAAFVLFVSSRASTPHYSRLGLNPDGGFMIYNNARGGGRQPTNQGYESGRAYGAAGLYPSGRWGITTRAPGTPGEDVPDLVFVFDEGIKACRLESRRSGGWGFEFRNAENQGWTAPLQ
jgi:hypothetical protein